MKQPTRPLALGFAAALAALGIFVWLANQVARGATIAFDAGTREAIHQYAAPPLTAVARALSELGSPDSLLIMGAGALVGMLALGWRRAAVRFVVTLAGALVLDAALKAGFHRTRPVSFFGTPLPASFSFPSGHALFSACFFGALAALITARIRSRAARVALWTVSCALAFAIGLSRIYLGVHYPSDVLAGYTVALVWVLAVAHADRTMVLRNTALPRETGPEPEQSAQP